MHRSTRRPVVVFGIDGVRYAARCAVAAPRLAALAAAGFRRVNEDASSNSGPGTTSYPEVIAAVGVGT